MAKQRVVSSCWLAPGETVEREGVLLYMRLDGKVTTTGDGVAIAGTSDGASHNGRIGVVSYCEMPDDQWSKPRMEPWKTKVGPLTRTAALCYLPGAEIPPLGTKMMINGVVHTVHLHERRPDGTTLVRTKMDDVGH